MRVSRAEIRRRWQERLASFAASDLSVAQFCEQEQVSAASFYLWRRRFRDPASAVSSESRSALAPRFLPVLLADSPPAASSLGGPSLDLELPNQVRLRMPRDIEAEFVGRLLVTVAALGPGGRASAASTREVR